jgi:hypothetical protein
MKEEPNMLASSGSDPASSDKVTAFCLSPDTSFGFDIMSPTTLETIQLLL